MSTPKFTAAAVEAKLEAKVTELLANDEFVNKFDAWLVENVEVLPRVIDYHENGLHDLFHEYKITDNILTAWFQGKGAGLGQIKQFFEARDITLKFGPLGQWGLFAKGDATEIGDVKTSAGGSFAALLSAMMK